MRRVPSCVSLAAVSIASALVSSCGRGSGPDGSGPTTTLELGLPAAVTSFANADVAVAEAQGFFRAAGLTVHVKKLASGVPVVEGVVGGRPD